MDSVPAPATTIDWPEVTAEAAHLLSRYLQFDTSNPPGNEAPALEFLAQQLGQHGFTPRLLYSAPNRANLIVRLPGQNPTNQAACLLYAHADVVPANAADWSVPPFSGQIKDDYIWGRGALDSKGLGIIFMQALTLLKRYAPPPPRDIILLIAADEEQTGQHGVAWLLNHHRALIEAEYVWDEGGMGLAQTSAPLYQIAVAEKIALTLKLVAEGTPGHASVVRHNNPHDRLVRALHRLKLWQPPARLTPTVVEMLHALAQRQTFPLDTLFAQAHRLLVWPLLRPWIEKDPMFSSLLRNTINLTMLRGGQASNVIPSQAEAWLDVRLLPDETPDHFLVQLRSIISDPKIAIEVESIPPAQTVTPIDTPFYRTLTAALRAQDSGSGQILPCLTPGATDSRYFRAAGMKAYGFVPMILSHQELSRIHGIDERVSLVNLEWGIRLVFETLQRLNGTD